MEPVTTNNHAFFLLPFIQYYSGKRYGWDFPTENDEKLLDILLYCNSKFDTIINQNILICNLKLTEDLHRFDNSLF